MTAPAPTELLPCQFCGGEARMSNTGTCWVSCSSFDCCVEGPIADTEQEAATAWNTRQAASVERAEVAGDLPDAIEMYASALDAANARIAELEAREWGRVVPSSEVQTTEPLGWLHEINEPMRGYTKMYSSSADNPWAHWLESYKADCSYKATPLYAAAAQASPDTLLIDWLEEQVVDVIYLDDGRIIDVKGNGVRKALAVASAKGESHD